MAIYAVVHADDDNEVHCYASCIANSPEEALERFVDPSEGYAPDHMDNTFEDMEELTDEEVNAYSDLNHSLHQQVSEKVKREALRRTKCRFALCGPECDEKGYDKDWTLLEFSTDTGNVTEYPR